MDESININVDLHKTATHYITISKTRLWAQILSSLNWMLSQPVSKITGIRKELESSYYVEP